MAYAIEARAETAENKIKGNENAEIFCSLRTKKKRVFKRIMLRSKYHKMDQTDTENGDITLTERMVRDLQKL